MNLKLLLLYVWHGQCLREYWSYVRCMENTCYVYLSCFWLKVYDL